jgi:hypothetical protein
MPKNCPSGEHGARTIRQTVPVSDVNELKAALLQIVELLMQVPTTPVAEGLLQASASFASLMQNSKNPLVPGIQGLLAELARDALELEGRPVAAEDMIHQLIASM